MKHCECVFDNPRTMRREGWTEGRCVWYIEAAWIFLVQDLVLSAAFVDLHIEWRSGRVVGDEEALPEHCKDLILKED